MIFCSDNIAGIAIQIKTGKTPSTKVSEYFNGDVDWYTPTDLSKGTYLGKSSRTITDKAILDKKAIIFEKDTVLISCIGDIGKLGIVTIPSSSNQQITGIKLNNKITPLFFYYWCKRNKKLLEKNSKKAVVPILNNAVLSRIKISYPENYDDQVRIAGVLSRVEGLIEKRKESIRLLDEFLESTFLEMFGDPVRNEKGWDSIKLNNVGSFISGGTPSKKREEYWIGDFPWVSPKDMKVQYLSNTQDHISENVFTETTLKRIDPDSILIVVRGMILAHTFPVAININPVSINQDMKAIRPSKYYVPIFLLYTLKNLDRKILSLVTSAGHGTKRLDSYSIENINVPKPPLSLQNQFVSIVNKIEAIKAKYQVSLEELERLYDSLSQRAFKGELDLSGVELK